uniref:Thaumatin-like protein n=1 Tax=Acrobeloides nanus TaxID=290746 RepID=A0A914E019_9BILA
MIRHCVIFALFCVGSFAGPAIHVYNKCPFEIWPGIQGNPLVANGGFHLAPGEARIIQVPDGWKAARIWARRNCDANMNCESGFCGNKVECGGAGGVPPVSLVEFTLNGAGNQDFYDVSLVDGYNLPIFVEPIPGTFTKIGGDYNCKRAGGCFGDLLETAPEELKVYKNGHVASVNSACMKFNTDQYCCRGAYGSPSTCNPNNWPFNYAAVFKQACPTAYSYAYDDKSSTFTCRGSDGRTSPDYTVQFC